MKSTLNLGAVFLFERLVRGEDFTKYIKDGKDKPALWMYELERKGYINIENNHEITPQGKEFYEMLTIGSGDIKTYVKEKKEKQGNDFDLWWRTFPPNDGFIYQNKKFDKSRGLRVDKDKCKELFTKMVSLGEYKAEEIIEATMIDVETRKRASFKSGENKLKYLQNSATYLRQKSFDGFIEEIGKKEKDLQQSNNVIDI